MDNLAEIVMGRKSVRSFDGNPISDQHRKALEEYIKGISNPFGIPVEFVLLDAGSMACQAPFLRESSCM